MTFKPTVLIFFILTLTSISGLDVEPVVVSNNLLSADLYKAIAQRSDDNFLVSPFSVMTALAFAQFGAQGSTGQEMRDALHLPHDRNQIGESFKNMYSFFKKKQQKGYIFHTANKMYFKDNVSINPKFNKIAKEAFESETESINFGRNIEAANRMNRWVEDKTNNKIHDLISSDKLDASTIAVLINALYFNGNWSSPFPRRVTKKQNFFKLDRTVVEVDTMHMLEESKTFRYAENYQLNAQFLELPFQGGEASMVFVVPFDKNGLSRLENNIDQVLAPLEFSREYVNISIPKFKIESKIDVKEVMMSLGLRKPFHPQLADFGLISTQNVFISDAIQKTFIDVHESGVEAAAATYTGFTLLSIQSTPTYKQFNADHPFIYYIKIGEMIVFVGRVKTPNY